MPVLNTSKKFLIGVSTSLKLVLEGIFAVKDTLPTWTNYLRQYETYGMVHPIEWEYEEKHRYKGDILSAKRRAYLLIYYNADKAVPEESRFNQHMTDFHQDLVAWKNGRTGRKIIPSTLQ